MKHLVPTLAALLIATSGCGLDQSKKPNPADEEPRHPSNAMNPLPKEEVPNPHPKKVAIKQAPPAVRKPLYEDPQKIPSGIQYSEMVRRFGPPTMKVTDSPGRTTYSYSKLKTQVQVEIQNGKVVSVASINTGF